jgi:DNA mismatch repair ATPase MutS
MKKIVLFTAISIFYGSAFCKQSTSAFVSSFQTIGEAIAPSLSALKKPNEIISSLDTYSTTLAILEEGARGRNMLTPATLHPTTINDLGLLFYDVSKPDFTVLKKIKRTHTILGECYLGHMLITPSADIPLLQKKQSIIRYLVEHDDHRKELSSFLKAFSEQEKQLLALWNKNDILYSKNMSQSIFGGNLKRKKSSAVMEFKRRFLDVFEPSSPFLGLAAAQFIKKLTPFEVKANATLSEKIKGGVFDGVTYGFTALGAAIAWKTSISKFKNRYALRVALKKRFQSLISFQKALNAITSYSANITADLIPALTAISEFTNPKNKEVNKFLYSLSDGAFRLDKGYWNASMGKLFAAVPQFLSLKKRICFALHALAELDALLSIATLYKEHEHLANKYCFATYKKFTTTPELSAINFWHPNIGSLYAVANTLQLGGLLHRRNRTLTGSNAAGKSTLVKGDALCPVLAQTITIAAAEEVVLTPFSIINTYLNIVEDAGNAVSQHRAEVRRAQELIQEILDLPEDQCAFTVMDEMFRCTNPAHGAAAAFAIGKILGKVKNSILILATHYFLLTKLAEDEESSFDNSCVHGYKQPDGSFKYPYKIFPGINTTVIALDMLAAEGFNKDILAYANEHLQRIESHS